MEKTIDRVNIDVTNIAECYIDNIDLLNPPDGVVINLHPESTYLNIASYMDGKTIKAISVWGITICDVWNAKLKINDWTCLFSPKEINKFKEVARMEVTIPCACNDKYSIAGISARSNICIQFEYEK